MWLRRSALTIKRILTATRARTHRRAVRVGLAARRYECEHLGDSLVVWTNKDSAINNRLVVAPLATPSAENWVESLPYDCARKIESVEVFARHLVIASVAVHVRACAVVRVLRVVISVGGARWCFVFMCWMCCACVYVLMVRSVWGAAQC